MLIFRVVKSAVYHPPSHTATPDLGAETRQNREVVFANEYVIDELEEYPNFKNFICNALVSAESELVTAKFHYVAVFKVAIGEKITFETPCTIYYPNAIDFSNPNVWINHPKIKIESESIYQRIEGVPYALSCDGFGWEPLPIGLLPDLADMFYAVTYEWMAETGAGRTNLYLNSVDKWDYYKTKKGRIHRQLVATKLDAKEKKFLDKMQLISPFMSHCYLGDDGVMKEGEPLTGELMFCALTEEKAMRRAEIALTERQYKLRLFLVASAVNYKASYSECEAFGARHLRALIAFDIPYLVIRRHLQIMRDIVIGIDKFFQPLDVLEEDFQEGDVYSFNPLYMRGCLDYTAEDYQGSVSRMNEYYLACILQSNYFLDHQYGDVFLGDWVGVFPDGNGSNGRRYFLSRYVYHPNGEQNEIEYLWRVYQDFYGPECRAAILDYFPLYENLSRFPNFLAIMERQVRPANGPKVKISNIEIPVDTPNLYPFSWLEYIAPTNSNLIALVDGKKARDAAFLAQEEIKRFQVRSERAFMPLDYCREMWDFSVPNRKVREGRIRTGERDLRPSKPCGNRIQVLMPMLAGQPRPVTIDEKNGWLDRAILHIYRQFACEQQPDLIGRGNWATDTRLQPARPIAGNNPGNWPTMPPTPIGGGGGDDGGGDGGPGGGPGGGPVGGPGG